MSRLEIVSVEEAMAKTASGKRAKIIHEYLGYIRELESGQAGMLSATEDESAIAIRRRLNQAAKAAGVEIVIKRSGDDVYFWVPSRRRGRPRKASV